MEETIICSAIWYKELKTQINLPTNCDKGLVICGRRHNTIIETLNILTNLRTISFGENKLKLKL